MLKRILAWVLLVGFILLLVNIVFIGYQRMLSVFIYVIIAGIYFLTMNSDKKNDR